MDPSTSLIGEDQCFELLYIAKLYQLINVCFYPSYFYLGI